MRVTNIPIGFILEKFTVHKTLSLLSCSNELMRLLGVRCVNLVPELPIEDHPPNLISLKRLDLFTPGQIVFARQYSNVVLAKVSHKTTKTVNKNLNYLDIAQEGYFNKDTLLLTGFQLKNLKWLAAKDESLSILIE